MPQVELSFPSPRHEDYTHSSTTPIKPDIVTKTLPVLVPQAGNMM
jgi:hypothetical protein